MRLTVNMQPGQPPTHLHEAACTTLKHNQTHCCHRRLPPVLLLSSLFTADVVEISPNAPLKRYSLDPKDVGIPRCEVADLAGGDAALNARILRDVFGGARGAVADALNLNAGYALAAAKVVPSPIEGVALAQEVQRAGKAAGTLDKWIAVSQEALQQEQRAAQQLTTAAA